MISGLMRLLAPLPALLVTLSCAAEDQPLSLSFPVDCEVGNDCWIVNYADRDSSDDAADYTCGTLTYDGHSGTDIAIRDMLTMRLGVDVLAAADGTVVRTRNSERDGRNEADRERARERGRECGNGVVIDHGGSWSTQYCHMKRGSVSVEPGDVVAAGQVIGQIGTSGTTEFPHLHLRVDRDGETIDPFTGTPVDTPCHEGGQSLWSDAVTDAVRYRRGQISNAGWSGSAPDWDRIRKGTRPRSSLRCDSEALVGWVEIFSVHAGDYLTVDLTGPDGKRFHSHDETLERTQARIFRFTGKRRRVECWPEGAYQAIFRLWESPQREMLLSEGRVTLEMLPKVDPGE